jgi:DNA-binding response OmpR family regulator
MEFQQLGPTRGQEVGTGLGLALTKHVIEAQGGRVGAESRFGVGSKFYAVLPRSPKPVAAGPMLDDSAAMAESKLLVVEDNVAASEWLAGALRDSGHHVKIAVTGADAITLCRAHMFDCILLDPLLPDTSGWEVLHALRARTLNRGTPALVVSLNPASEAAGGFAVLDFLMKPLNPGDLLASLERGGVPPDGRKTVLVVDQDVKALRMMQASLTSLGYRVSCHSDAEAGLASALRNTPAAVVLDLTMPGTSGFEFLDRLRADVRGYQIPVLVWANKDLDEEDYAVLKSNLARVFLCEKSTLQAFTGDLRELLKGRM